MKKVNVVYEYDFNEVDIILIPDFVEEKLNEYVQKFFNWLAQSTDSRFCKITKSGYGCLTTQVQKVIFLAMEYFHGLFLIS